MADEIESIRPKGLLILFTSFKLLNILDDKSFRHVIAAMAAYVENGTEPEGLEPIEQVAFESQRKALDDNIEIYRKSTIAHREAGKKGGRPKKTEGNPEKPIGFSENQMEPNGFTEKPKETNSPKILNIKDYSDTKVSDTTTVVEHDLDADLSKIAHHFQEAFGDLPPSVGYKISSWRQTFSAEMIILAIDRAAEAGKRNWTYVDGTLRGWKRDGITNPAGVAASDEQWQNRQQGGKSGAPGGGKKLTENVAEAYANIFKGVK